MRTKHSIRNLIFSFSGQVLSTFILFACRMVFVRTLDAVYLGVYSFFTDVISLLSLSELGIGSAIIFFMYEPVAKGDYEKVKKLLALYRDLYRKIGIVVAVIGLALMPLINYLANDIADGLQNITLIYGLYVLNMVISYFYSYKRSIIEVHQMNYIALSYQYFLYCIQGIIQIVLLILTHNFIFYLMIQVCSTFAINYLIAKKADRMYPFIKEPIQEPLAKVERNKILRHIKAMFMHRLGEAVVNGTDSILLTVFSGLASAGIYSNYRLIINTISQIIRQIFNAITSSIGNLGVLENKEKIHTVFKLLNFADYWIVSFCTICLGGLLNPFIELCFGVDYTFETGMVLILLCNFYLTGMRQVVLRFRDALGLFWHDRYKAILEAVINLLASIILSQIYGIIGVFIGTMISTLSTAFWIEPYVLFKYGFRDSMKGYYLQYLKYVLVLLFNGSITMMCVSYITGGGIGNFLIRLLISAVLPNFIMIIVFARKEEFQFYSKMILHKLRRNK